MADFMLMAELSRTRRTLVTPLLDSLDNIDFQNVNCADSIPFDMGLEQAPATANITPTSNPPTIIFCPSHLPTGDAEYDHISTLTLKGYSFFWVKADENLTTHHTNFVCNVFVLCVIHCFELAYCFSSIHLCHVCVIRISLVWFLAVRHLTRTLVNYLC